MRPGGTLSSLGVYSGKLVAPYEAVYAGLGDQRIVTTLCPGGKERMRRLMAMVQNDRMDLTPLVTHHFFALEATARGVRPLQPSSRRRHESGNPSNRSRGRSRVPCAKLLMSNADRTDA